MITFHSVMESPEPVRRVIPPMTTIAKIRKHPEKSQITIRRFEFSIMNSQKITIREEECFRTGFYRLNLRTVLLQTCELIVFRFEKPAVIQSKAESKPNIFFTDQIIFGSPSASCLGGELNSSTGTTNRKSKSERNSCFI